MRFSLGCSQDIVAKVREYNNFKENSRERIKAREVSVCGCACGCWGVCLCEYSFL